MSSISRREFVATSAGLVVSFYLPSRLGPSPTAAPPPFAPNAWLRVGGDGIVTLTLDRSEMGQGAQTGLAIILAEELDADWASIRLGPMPENPAGWSRIMRTGGSNAIRSSWEPLRKAGAAARAMLVTAAAEAWKVDRSTCRADKGAVIHVPSGRRLSYGSLAARAAALPVPTDAPLKDAKDFHLVGTRVTRLDTPSKVDGSAQFGIDVKIPGMLVASIERSPVLGGRVKRFNADRAKAMPGVRHVVALEPSSWIGAGGAWAARWSRIATGRPSRRGARSRSSGTRETGAHWIRRASAHNCSPWPSGQASWRKPSAMRPRPSAARRNGSTPRTTCRCCTTPRWSR